MCSWVLKAVDFELVGLYKANLDHPIADVVPLISLKLEDFPIFRVLHYRSIASKFLFARTNNFLEVILLGETLNSGQSFSSVPLLNSDVD